MVMVVVSCAVAVPILPISLFWEEVMVYCILKACAVLWWHQAIGQRDTKKGPPHSTILILIVLHKPSIRHSAGFNWSSVLQNFWSKRKSTTSVIIVRFFCSHRSHRGSFLPTTLLWRREESCIFTSGFTYRKTGTFYPDLVVITRRTGSVLALTRLCSFAR